MGIPSAMNIDILANQDFVWGVALMISGIFFALAASKYGIEKILKEYNSSQFDWQFPNIWRPLFGGCHYQLQIMLQMIGIILFHNNISCPCAWCSINPMVDVIVSN